MPVYLAHGFKWARDGLSGIRAYSLMNNLEDVSGEYLQNETTANVLLHSFRGTFPEIMPKLEDAQSGRTLYFLEQYDPEDELSDTAASQYFCFVADRYITIAAGKSPCYPDMVPKSHNLRDGQKHNSVEERPKTASGLDARTRSRPATAKLRTSKPPSPLPLHDISALSVNVDEALSGATSSPEAWAAFAELRDQLAEGEKIGWWMVYNGDPARPWLSDSESQDASYLDESTEGSRTPTQSEPYANTILGLPLPSLLPKDFHPNLSVQDQPAGIGIAIHHPPPHPPPPPPPLERPAQFADGHTPPRPKSSRAGMYLRRKLSRANLQPKSEPVPDLPKLKEMSKKEGFRARFFGRSKLQG